MVWIFFSLLAALSTAALTVLTKLGLHYLDPLVITALQTFVTAIALIAVVFYSKSSLLYTEASLYSASIIILGVIANILSYVFFAYAMKFGPVIHVSSLYLLNLPFTFIISTMLLNEVIGLKVIMGAFLMLGGAILLTI